MKWGAGRRSGNIEDRRGGGGGGFGGGKLSGGAVLVVIVLSLLFGKNPLEMLGLVEQAGVGAEAPVATGVPEGR